MFIWYLTYTQLLLLLFFIFHNGYWTLTRVQPRQVHYCWAISEALFPLFNVRQGVTMLLSLALNSLTDPQWSWACNSPVSGCWVPDITDVYPQAWWCLILFKSYILHFYSFMRELMRVCPCGGQMTWGSWFSSTMWVLGTELGMPGLTANVYTWWANSLVFNSYIRFLLWHYYQGLNFII